MSTEITESTTGTEPQGRVTTLAGWLLALVAAGLLALVGLPEGFGGLVTGALGGIALLVAWFLLEPPYAFAAGALALVAVLAGRQPEPIALLTGGVLVALLVVSDVSTGPGKRRALGTLAFTGTLAGVAWGAQGAWAETWATALVLVSIGTLIAYGLHRYEQVQLGVPTRE